MAERFDLSVRRRIHVVGVGGPGMSAIATVLVEMGHDVSGSDVRENAATRRLRGIGVPVVIGHAADAVADRDAVTYSTAIPLDNIELEEARRRGVPCLHRAEMLAAVCARAEALGVAGTHGKTTTSSMLRAVLDGAGLAPSYVIGGEVRDTGAGASWTGGRFLVVEADESDGTYRRLPLTGAIVTNIDVDHLDHFGDFDALVADFELFVAGVAGPVAVCLDDPHLSRMAAGIGRTGLVGYGSGPSADVRWSEVVARGSEMEFVVSGRFGRRRARLPLRGDHNVANACGALALATSLGVDIDPAVEALGVFGGVGRRFDVIGSAEGATFVDDYAHLPREIEAVLRAARRSGEWSRVVAVFQPNRFNRMAAMSGDYADAFAEADVVVITDIYSSGTAPIPGVTGHLVVEAVRRAHPSTPVEWVPRRADLPAAVSGLVRPGDVCVSMGCGDIEHLPREILELRSHA